MAGFMRQLFVCMIGIYGSFLSWAVMQEKIITRPYDGERFSSPALLSLAQSFMTVLCGLLWNWFHGVSARGLLEPKFLGYFSSIAISASLSSYFGYASMFHLSYPTVILGKSCKLLPVIALHVFVYKRKFPPHKYLIVTMITAGVSIFSYFQNTSSKGKHAEHDSPIGLLLLFFNLLMDGITNTTQDKVFGKYKLSSVTMMIAVNLGIACLNGLYLISPFCNQQPLSFINRHPSILKDMLLFACTGSVGQLFIFFTLEKFGSITLVTITLTRKIFTMLLSVFHFHHTVSSIQWLGILLVFLGISLEAGLKILNNNSTAKKKAS
ncbi:ER uridine diphosphate-glucose transmembrane transporter Hut1 [Schizosaccharomyces pombe]|uniref:UDP-galactose transporter homolog 1 n=1 Tax=Schizosaccharomyces pombe (strain 972 / ATCC 24843) TaxID=284812 RepID=HUT1_SCHPO|nr:uridine diphosphate-N-acetylglucosamine transporter Hut1 [Schizosaccharomyces pombe]Q8WZJ9.1 RecName: Full=UDP-galactose transporter homolog 1 [Schizosaccharomyces pombe 972h-]CAB46704.1 uridine diphosphate-N-acetylglucosamine transporter Hut1 [Schizosaccharomyces pombe]|eukprot:NP_595251.1 uridine diphosphate-N-acetylglucosamine transporter Hut1 [Schizosaccharomyces pombe]